MGTTRDFSTSGLSQATELTSAESSTPDNQDSGRAAIDRILADGGSAGFSELLQRSLGSLAEELQMSTPPPQLIAVAAEISTALQAEASAAPQGAHHDEAALTRKLRQTLERLILENSKRILALLPNGAALQKRLEARLGATTPFEVWAGVLLAAVGAYLSDMALGHQQTFKINDSLSSTLKVDAGTIQNLAMKSVSASITYHHEKLTATLTDTHNFGGTNTASAQLTIKDLEILHQKIDQTMLRFNHVTFQDGRPPTEQFVASIAGKLHGFGYKLSGTESLSAAHGNKSDERKLSNSVSQELSSPSFEAFGAEGWKASLTATEHFGANHAQNQVGAKLSFPKFHDIAVTIGETVPIGSGKGKPQLSAGFDWKGIKLTISQGAIPHSSSGTTLTEDLGKDHGWHVGITLPVGGG